MVAIETKGVQYIRWKLCEMYAFAIVKAMGRVQCTIVHMLETMGSVCLIH